MYTGINDSSNPGYQSNDNGMDYQHGDSTATYNSGGDDPMGYKRADEDNRHHDEKNHEETEFDRMIAEELKPEKPKEEEVMHKTSQSFFVNEELMKKHHEDQEKELLHNKPKKSFEETLSKVEEEINNAIDEASS